MESRNFIFALTCLSLSGSTPRPEDNKNLKPALSAQLYTAKAKKPTGGVTFKRVATQNKHITAKTTENYMPPKDKEGEA